MPRTTAFEGRIEYLQILDQTGKIDKKIGIPKDLDNEKLVDMLRWMIFLRRFDEKALALQRTGRLGTYASLIGQEGAQVGAGFAMAKQDWLAPSFREQGLMMQRGVPGSKILAYWGGDERGSEYEEGVNSLPICVPIGSQLLHGVGMAMGFSRQEKTKDTAVLLCIGDGGTSEGDFHEACNFAAVFKAPAVFLIQNNQWAISVPRSHQSRAKTIAQKSLAYGVEGIQVDGNDVLAMYQATSDALALARKSGKPTIIEAFTYRMEDHTTADDASKYRSQEEVDSWKPKDPIIRFEKLLRRKKLVNDKLIAEMEEEAIKRVAKEVADREALGSPDPLNTFRYLYEEIPPHLKEQMAEMEESLS